MIYLPWWQFAIQLHQYECTLSYNLARPWKNGSSGMCSQWRFCFTYLSAQSCKSLQSLLYEEPMICRCHILTVKDSIRLHRCEGWSLKMPFSHIVGHRFFFRSVLFWIKPSYHKHAKTMEIDVREMKSSFLLRITNYSVQFMMLSNLKSYCIQKSNRVLKPKVGSVLFSLWCSLFLYQLLRTDWRSSGKEEIMVVICFCSFSMFSSVTTTLLFVANFYMKTKQKQSVHVKTIFILQSSNEHKDTISRVLILAVLVLHGKIEKKKN